MHTRPVTDHAVRNLMLARRLIAETTDRLRALRIRIGRRTAEMRDVRLRLERASVRFDEEMRALKGEQPASVAAVD